MVHREGVSFSQLPDLHDFTFEGIYPMHIAMVQSFYSNRDLFCIIGSAGCTKLQSYLTLKNLSRAACIAYQMPVVSPKKNPSTRIFGNETCISIWRARWIVTPYKMVQPCVVEVAVRYLPGNEKHVKLSCCLSTKKAPQKGGSWKGNLVVVP